MPLYGGLFRLTDKGRATIKDAPARNQANLKAAEALGVKNIQLYAALGEYDYIGIGDFPNEDVVKLFQAAVEAGGFVTMNGFRLFTLEDWAKIVKKLP